MPKLLGDYYNLSISQENMTNGQPQSELSILLGDFQNLPEDLV
jgi:hypothetical protein